MTGGMGLTKETIGTLTLNGVSNFTGPVSVISGELNITSSTAMPMSNNNVVVNSAALLELKATGPPSTD